ncbi:MAG: 2-aminoethylphosphonate--pyruvate transaminase [Anaeromicrobium sp.]|jgi:2-aminoethylphosphonate-pyruvate transaminase|uniref:2-aminoethylphosphonate--pyruvate transaminase n=1 Tax=Anaeromicrobium sp. TaxID=1929132 RepID=UPI0025E00800|nr:2-aminoethylphosphonate--pyruvate transaminase [Anaeromicrobium sp.]MCT4592719.1 2-aminoethylphosphonate--pyruvate transaminase [Anaeromicrobium sp.]
MNNYKLLTPGPLTTTNTVKEEMLIDRCTWDDDYKSITQKIRKQLLEIGKASLDNYTTVLIQGSGSFAVESVITTAMSHEDKLLIISNGAYGERIIEMSQYIGINHVPYRLSYDEVPKEEEIINILKEDKEISHIVMVHCETTTGILNPIEVIAKLAKEHEKTLIIDAMSSFGGIEINIEELGIDFLISSANKCIQGVPGFSFVIGKKNKLLKCEGNSRSLCLDLFEQWKVMDKDGKWRYTSPTHVVGGFSKAIDELIEEGGVTQRYMRYKTNNKLLRSRLKEIGFNPYIQEENQSPIITTFLFPTQDFDFISFYNYMKERGFVIYPGKLTDVDTFRMGNIGEIYEEDINNLCDVINEYVKVVRK